MDRLVLSRSSQILLPLWLRLTKTEPIRQPMMQPISWIMPRRQPASTPTIFWCDRMLLDHRRHSPCSCGSASPSRPCMPSRDRWSLSADAREQPPALPLSGTHVPATSGRRSLPPHACSEAVSVFLKSPKVGFQQRKYFLSIPCIHARRPQTGYEALLLMHKASRFGDVPLNTVKVIFEAHIAGRTTPWHSGFEA